MISIHAPCTAESQWAQGAEIPSVMQSNKGISIPRGLSGTSNTNHEPISARDVIHSQGCKSKIQEFSNNVQRREEGIKGRLHPACAITQSSPSPCKEVFITRQHLLKLCLLPFLGFLQGDNRILCFHSWAGLGVDFITLCCPAVQALAAREGLCLTQIGLTSTHGAFGAKFTPFQRLFHTWDRKLVIQQGASQVGNEGHQGETSMKHLLDCTLWSLCTN